MTTVLKSSFGKLLYYNKPITEIKYGALYNWYAASKNGGTGAGSIAPSGWHVPSKAEWETLVTTLGENLVAGSKLKEIGTVYWLAEFADNSSGFYARGSGYRNGIIGTFSDLLTNAYITSVSSGDSDVSGLFLYAASVESYQFSGIFFSSGTSIRLIKDTSTWTEGETLTDIDGNVYPTVKIGNQVWMAANLAVTHYNDGTPIPNVTDNAAWAALTTGAYCWYDNDINNAYSTVYTSKILATQ